MVIEKVLKEMKLDPKMEDTIYSFNNKPVPRVTHILSAMLHEEYLMKWANNIGIYQRRNYIDEKDKAAFIGTTSHNTIEYFIKNNTFNIDNLNIDEKSCKKINNCVESFIKWYQDISCNNINVLGIEQPLSCPWFGGTYDMKIQINDKIYLTDFKTSNYIGYKYFLQLAAYYYIMQNQGENIDGFIILQLNKNKIAYTEYVLSFDNEQSINFLNQCITTFLSLVYAYYNRLEVEHQFNTLFKGEI